MDKIVFGFDGEFIFSDEQLKQITKPFEKTFQFATVTGEADTEELRDAAAFIGWPTDRMIQAMEQVRWIQLPSAGANHFASHPDLADDVVITNASGVFGIPGAEQILALILAFARQLPIHVRQTERHVWRRNPKAIQVAGSTVAIIGLGDIGSEAAIRLKAFGARVLGVKRTTGEKPDYVDALFNMNHIGEVLGQSDFVVNVLPLTPETDKVFDRDLLMKMKPGAIFINVGRGKTVDEAALADLLKSGHIGGAGLDVTATEPLPASSGLWNLPDVLITSHSLGVAPEKQAMRATLIRENLKRFRDGVELVNRVNRKLGY